MAGVIPYASIPTPVPAGLMEACEAALTAAGFPTLVTRAPDGVHVSDVDTVLATIAAYTGSAAELAFHRAQKQAELDAFFDERFDLVEFIRSGTTATLTGAQVGAFLAAVTNNYRSKRIAIANAATVALVNAVSVSAGWPGNP